MSHYLSLVYKPWSDRGTHQESTATEKALEVARVQEGRKNAKSSENTPFILSVAVLQDPL